MSWRHLRDRVGHAHKMYDCILCNERIHEGDIYINRVGTDSCERGIFTQRMHIECEAQTHDWDEGDWEGHGQHDGEFKRPVKEVEVK